MTTLDRFRALLGKLPPGPWTARHFRTYPPDKAHLERWSVCHAGDEPPLIDDELSEDHAKALAALGSVLPELLALIDASVVPIRSGREVAGHACLACFATSRGGAPVLHEDHCPVGRLLRAIDMALGGGG